MILKDDEKYISTVTVDSERFENLVRDSEMLLTVQRFVEQTEFVSTKDLKILLGIRGNE